MKEFFPVFKKYSDLIYLDNTATTQKPQEVITAVDTYISESYANIHRWVYDLSEKSEIAYSGARKKVAHCIHADISEIIFTGWSTDSVNFLASTLFMNGVLKRGDVILLSILEHHANIVPWLILQKQYGITVRFFHVNKETFEIDWEDFSKKYTDDVKIVSLTQTSNVTGGIWDMKKVKEKLRDDTIFVVDGSQSVPNFEVNVRDIDCDFLFFSGHKIMAHTGIGVLYGKKYLLKKLHPAYGGGGAIGNVFTTDFTYAGLPDKWEPGTPNLIGAVSLGAAIDFLNSHGWYEALEKKEQELISYALQEFSKIPEIKILGNKDAKKRVGAFSFIVLGAHVNDVNDFLADSGISIRSGHHCCEPFMEYMKIPGSCRMSVYWYNSISDLDAFFSALRKFIKNFC